MYRIKIKGKGLPKAQYQNSQVGSDDDWIRKIMEYEATQGGYNPSTGKAYGLPNWGYNSRNPTSIQQAIDFYKQDFLPQVQQYPMGMRERAGDFMYNAGRDPRIYMLDQYLRTTGDKQGLPNRSSYNIDMNKNPADWARMKPQFENVWNQYSSNINNLPLQDQIGLLDRGRDFYYQNINQVNGKPNPAYAATWGPRVNMWGQYQPPAPQVTPQVQTQSVPQQPVQTPAAQLVASAPPPVASQPITQTNDDNLGEPPTIRFSPRPGDADMAPPPEVANDLAKERKEFEDWQKKQQTAVPTIMGPKEDEVDKKYKSDPMFQARYDASLIGAQRNRKEAKQYNKFVQNKYNPFYKQQKMANTLTGIGYGLAGASALVDFFENRRKQKDYDRWFRKQNLPENMYAVGAGDDRGDWDINEGVYQANRLTPPNPGAYYEAAYGGTQPNPMNRLKIRIKSAPQTMEYGGQQRKGMSLGLDLGQRNVYRDMPKEKSEHARDVIPEVPRSQANIEAERGETVYGDLDGDGSLEHMKIGGKRHTEGGTPLNVPEGSFIFSDTKKMTIKDPVILEKFGMKPRKEGYTPADIAKKYDINKYKAIMEDPNMDPVRKSTAQLMIKNFTRKLAELALIQEGMKGFPQGVPQVARQTLPEAEQLAQSMEQEQVMEQGPSVEQQEGMAPPMGEQPYPEDEQMMEQEQMAAMQQPQQMPPQEMMEEQPEMGYGGYIPMYQGVTGSSTITPYGGGRNPITPTGQSNIFTRGPEYLQSWEQYIPGISNMTNAQAQGAIYDYTLATDPTRAGQMWKQYGLTAKGKKDPNLVKLTDKDPNTERYKYTFNRDLTGAELQSLKPAYVDALFGARQIEPFGTPPPPPATTEVPGYLCIDGQVKTIMYKSEAERTAAGAKPTEALAAVNCSPSTPPNPFYGRNIYERNRWMTPDKVNMAVAMMNPPKKYPPFAARAIYEPNRLSLEDPRAQLAAEQSMFNKQAELMGVYGPTTGQAANRSSAAGQQAERASAVLSGVNSRNVDRVNQFLAQERARKDQYNLLGAERVTNLFDKNTIMNQYYDNAKRAYLNNIAKTFGQGWHNAMKLGMLNAVNPRYKVEPIFGNTYYTGAGYGTDRFGSRTGGYTMSNYPTLKNEYMAMGMTSDQAHAAAINTINKGSTGSADDNGQSWIPQYTFPYTPFGT